MFTSKNLKKLLPLVLVFLLCFSASLFIFKEFVLEDSSEGQSSNLESPQGLKRGNFFPESIPILKSGRYFSVAHRDELLPASKGDYLLLFWFNLKELPTVDDKLVLLSKYSGAPPKIQGFAVGLKRDRNALRPTLFWGDGSAAGRWHDFPEISFVVNEWNLLAIDVHNQKFVGMYSARIAASTPSELSFLGGHEINLPDPIDFGKADIVFGAPPGREFKGRLGPLAIINPLKDAGDVSALISSYLKSPQNFSLLGAPSDFKLLVQDGKTDSSPLKNPVTTNY